MSRYSFMRKQIVAVILLVMVLLVPGLTYGSSVPVHLNTGVDAGLAKDFLDRSWGIRPDGFPSAMHITDLDENLAVYTADIDVSPILGTVQACSNPRLVFAKDGGLVQAVINFDAKEYNQVQEHLNRLLGEPSPIIYERMVGKVDFEERTEWLVGQTTKIAIVSRWSGASIELSKREFILQQERSFEELFAAALLKQASEYERRDRLLEASSVYQELLNGTRSYHSFTPAAQERLVEYSRRKDAVDYLGKNDGFVFSILKNIFPDSGRQQWMRIDLDFTAQEDLKRHRSDEGKQQDSLANLSSVLCRVQVDSVNGKYMIIDQIWLDSSERIIGGRPAWAPQETGWPASFIKQVCEGFLEKWFSFGSSAGMEKLSSD